MGPGVKSTGPIVLTAVLIKIQSHKYLHESLHHADHAIANGS